MHGQQNKKKNIFKKYQKKKKSELQSETLHIPVLLQDPI